MICMNLKLWEDRIDCEGPILNTYTVDISKAV